MQQYTLQYVNELVYKAVLCNIPVTLTSVFFVLFCLLVYFYSSGLFPLLANAAMSVKPALLSLYEMYYLPLGKTLKPGLQGLLTGILPGLEEGSEYYER